MNRICVLFGTITLAGALLVGGGATQEKKGEPKKTPKGMLPQGFKDLGLSADQKSKIYSLQAEYKTKIVELEKKVKDMKAEETAAVFKVLTDDQREKYLKAKGVDTKAKDKEKDKKDK